MPVVKEKERKLLAGAQLPRLTESIRPPKDAYFVHSANGPKVDANSFRVLVVDDDPIILNLVAKMAERLGHYATVVEDAMAALFHLAAAHYHLVITDYQMPFMDGFQLALRIKAQHRGTRVIVMTGHCKEEVTNWRNGSSIVDGFLYKPFDLNALKAKIEALDDRHDDATRHVNALGG
jgi:DNA-binding response OmpR family regulator